VQFGKSETKIIKKKILQSVSTYIPFQLRLRLRGPKYSEESKGYTEAVSTHFNTPSHANPVVSLLPSRETGEAVA
jgi:hypothetical protein